MHYSRRGDNSIPIAARGEEADGAAAGGWKSGSELTTLL
jgi:hypothetical protein